MIYHWQRVTALSMLFVFPVGAIFDPKQAMDHPHTHPKAPSETVTETTGAPIVFTPTSTKAVLNIRSEFK